MEKDLMNMESFANSKNKFGYFYLLTPKGFAQKTAMTSRFLERKIAEYEKLRGEIEALQIEVHQQTPFAPATSGS